MSERTELPRCFAFGRAVPDALLGPLEECASPDNRAPIRPVRLSCDVRYQPQSEAFDPRYMGPDPGGTFGGGYGELNGAKPLTEDWHQR